MANVRLLLGLLACGLLGAIGVVAVLALCACRDDWGSLRVAAAVPLPPAGAPAIREAVHDVTRALEGTTGTAGAACSADSTAGGDAAQAEAAAGAAHSRPLAWWWGDGTLLGAVRDGDIIPWDYDADMYVVADDYDDAVWRLRARLQPRGYRVTASRTGARVVSPRRALVDVLVLAAARDAAGDDWLVPLGNSALPFEAPLRLSVHRDMPAADYLPVTRAEGYAVAGVPVPVPARPERVLAGTYGPDYMVPRRKNLLNDIVGAAPAPAPPG